jgi:hypothetical protein
MGEDDEMKETDMQITIIPTSGTDLHCHYEGQVSPQPCYIALDARTGTVSAEYDPNPGPCPSRTQEEYDGFINTWEIPCLSASSANALLAEIATFAKIVINGFRTHYEPARGRQTAAYSPAAISAISAISEICADTSHLEILHTGVPEDYFIDSPELELAYYGLDRSSAPEEIIAVCEEIAAEAITYNTVYSVDDLCSWLEDAIADQEVE